MAGYPQAPNGQFLPSPTSPYCPRTPPPQRTNIPPAASYVPPSTSPYPVGGLQGTLSTVTKEVGGVLKGLTKVGAKALNKVLDHPTLANIKSGNVVSFISRISGQSLQILQAPDGRLVLDCLGGDGHQFVNAHFTIVQDREGYILLHNNFNYLAIKEGTVQLYSAGPNGLPTPECRFKVREVLMQNQFVTVESVSERGRYIAVLPNGQMKSAIATTGADQDTHFAVRLIYSPQSAFTTK
ncbi:uncharacterized protein LOC129234661 isoform X1 [Uloborus diversus]|uniref:uncharacterized protein LOC129234661 isoform X1 n=1 Tax=Uloborus diversus TaxID=327109 RepID=UPI002409815E|nr:uncharacterized protein LOC129234661 isoform X1 [Uloborus diversus]XP_054724677.1 uncharacterized protein LOC129234661 isoform X1 [Uloborus diversus]